MLLRWWQIGVIFVLFSLVGQPLSAQDSTLHWLEPSPTPNPKRIRSVAIGAGAMYTVTMAGLYQLWYADFEQSPFQFFDDNDEWEQIDKIGHTTTAFYVGLAGIKTMKWTGMPRKKAIWYGGSIGFAFLTTVEIFDGFSAEWGFSNGDMVANAAGTALAIGQELAWDEQRVLIKFSYRPTDLAQLRPETLGSSWNERILKDYNGQSYWLTYPISLAAPRAEFIPSWLAVSVGYGANNMLGGPANPAMNAEGVLLPDLERYREYFLSLDVDLTRIKTNKRFLRTMFTTFGYLKVPFPGLRYSRVNGLDAQWISG